MVPILGKWLYPKSERVECDSFWVGGSQIINVSTEMHSVPGSIRNKHITSLSDNDPATSIYCPACFNDDNNRLSTIANNKSKVNNLLGTDLNTRTIKSETILLFFPKIDSQPHAIHLEQKWNKFDSEIRSVLSSDAKSVG